MAPPRGPPSGPRKRDRREPGSETVMQAILEITRKNGNAPVRVTVAAIEVGRR